jgi:predicted phosphohydrolase
MLDLTDNLSISKIHYFVISGDLTNASKPEEYDAVFELINDLKLKLNVSSDRLILVPGNHDLSWDISSQAYSYVPKHQLPAKLSDDFVPLSEGGALRRDEDKSRKRFDNFSNFYKRVCGGETYPINYEDQAQVHVFPEDRILFLTLNSAWQIDDHFTQRSSINMSALSKALSKMHPSKHDGWLKIVAWHHPVTGKEGMNAEFLEQLAVKKFEVCMHGHIHESIEGYHKYDDQRGLHIIGSGTFGAPAKEQVTSVPLQYNLIEFDLQNCTLLVRSRKKEKVDGAWSADARWGNKESPVPHYSIKLTKYKPLNPR